MAEGILEAQPLTDEVVLTQGRYDSMELKRYLETAELGIAGYMLGTKIAVVWRRGYSNWWALVEAVRHNYWAHAVALVAAPVRLLAEN